MADNVSTAGHGPPRGYSGMNKALDRYLKGHPDHAGETASRSRSLGRPSNFGKAKLNKLKSEAHSLLNLERIRCETVELYQFLKWVHGDGAAENPWEMPVKRQMAH